MKNIFVGKVQFAQCHINSQKNSELTGLILFRQKTEDSNIESRIKVNGLNPGKYAVGMFHAIHIHEYGERFESCESTGPHFNPYNRKHPLHVGDLSNVYLKSNTTILFYPNVKGTFFGSNSLYGRSVVVSENEDDKGNGSNKLSELDGNSGRSLSCCTIAVADNFLWLNVVEKLRFPG
uniref:Superoxide dismutase copper/zinc binding domain-containing protein n=1 Tax=Callorhinchus milii TaxID=7868 RepID=A0A4W3IAE3_CALMI